MIIRALLSVSDKEGIAEFAKRLAAKGIEIIATGGTWEVLKVRKVSKVRKVEDLTGFPECFGGRVKTIHPKIIGGILMDRKKDRDEAMKLGIEPIDMVVVNLYPFDPISLKLRGAGEKKYIERIDIGGVTLLRAAAKNSEWVTVVCDPSDYERVALEIEQMGDTTPELRRELAAKAFLRTAAYDAAITEWVSGGGNHALFMTGGKKLRYGENPHQTGRRYSSVVSCQLSVVSGIANATVLQGKEMSYLNYLDADAAWQCVMEFTDPTVVFLKHASPCGVASNSSILEAFRRGHDSDPRSAFGVIIALNRECPVEIVREIIDRKIFTELLLAPAFADEALVLLKEKPNIRVLVVRDSTLRDAQPHLACLPEEATSTMLGTSSGRLEGCGWAPPIGPALGSEARARGEAIRAEWQGDIEYRSISGGVLVQSRDRARVEVRDLRVVTKRKPTKDQIADLLFAAKVVKHVKSNAIVLAKDRVTVGIGPGQTSRVDAVEIAVRKMSASAKASADLRGAVMASDAFFPFPDSVEEAAKHGIVAIIQPGGSVRDQEVIAAADKLGISMAMTGLRSFRH